VPKYRHHLYDWLGVSKVELAIMAELLMRGAQTVGELRTRASRMEPISDISSLWPLLDDLRSRQLVVYLTPKGRGCIVTHGLYKPTELEKLKTRHSGDESGYDDDGMEDSDPSPSSSRGSSAPQAVASLEHGTGYPSDLAEMRQEINELREEVSRLTEALRTDLDDVRRQLGM
jgi:uncharacterized protein YceH (UPF0502 family)